MTSSGAGQTVCGPAFQRVPQAGGRLPGSILQINSSSGGLPKRAMLAGFIGPLGLEGDNHAHPKIHGGPHKAILLIAAEIVDDLAARGYPVFYGALGENLTTRGIDIQAVRVGDRLRAGSAILEITQPRGPCTALDVYGPSIKDQIYDLRVKLLDPTSPHWGMSGLYASVIEPGGVHPGDAIELLPAP